MKTENKKTILLVEDEALIALATQDKLEKYSYNILTTGKGESAVELSEKNDDIDLILMDIDLGRGMDGTEAAELILKKREIPVVFLSSHMEPEIVEKTEKITSYGYVVKSSSITVLDASIKMAFKLFDAKMSELEKKDALKESEARLLSILENNRDWIWEIDLSGRHTYSNHRLLELLGYSPEEFVGKEYLSFLHEDDQRNINQTLPQLIAEKRGWNGWALRWRNKDGTYRWLESNANPIINTSGEIVGFSGADHDITKRKRVEDKLGQSEARMKALSEASFEAIFLSEEGICIDQNLTAEMMFGYTRAEAFGRAGIEWIVPEDQELVKNNIQAGYENLYEVTALRKDKTTFPCEIQARMTNYQNRPVRITALRDITERKQTEEALRQSNELLSLFIQKSPIYTYIKEVSPTESRILRASENYQDLIGIPGSEMAGSSMAELFPAELAAKFSADDWTVVSSGKVLKVDEDLNGRNFTTIKFPISLGGKNLLAGYSIDITERKLAEESLRQYKHIVASSLDMLALVDEKLIYLSVNTAYAKAFNKTPDELIGNTVAEVFGNEFFDKVIKSHAQRCLNGEVVTYQDWFDFPAYEPRYMEINYYPYVTADNLIKGYVVNGRDKTEKQKLEDYMQRAQKLESLGVLAGGIAHDFNNLLSTIFGYIEMAIGETTEKNVSTFLAESLNNLNRARALTQQLLTFAKGGAPKKRVENLFPFVQKTAQFALSGSSVSCRFQIQENLWQCDFDKNQIGQVIDNFTINAQQAMPNGGTIEVSARNISLSAKEHILLAAGNYVKLSIKDQGIGIPKEFLTHIFDPYYTTKSKGHGLGLSTCYSIVNRHNGCIDVESEPGKGSTFHVYLPASIESISTIAEESAVTHTGSGTFLVMDDEEAIRNLMEITLESFGYSVVLKENGKDAIDFFVTEKKANRKLAGMIFDLTIPGGMGGKEAIGEIRKICPNTPVFVASGYADNPIIANPEEYGFTASIRKPFMKAELSEMLEKHLKKLK